MNPRYLLRTALLMLLTTLMLAPATTASAQDEEEASSEESELAQQLPAVDLPTMNAMNYRFELDSSWTGLVGTPEELPVYQFDAISYTEEEITQIAEELGIEGEVNPQGEGSYSVAGNGSIFTTPGLLQYVSPADVAGEDLPDDEEAIAFARDWLRTADLLPANVGDGEVLARIEAPARIIVGFQPSVPSPILGSTPGITVNVGPGGAVIEARINWATITESDTYRLRAAEDAFAVIASRQSYLDVSLPADQYPQGSTISGAATFDSVSIAYASSGVPGETQFLQPVYVFEGDLVPDESDDTYTIIAYVPAIVTGLEPVG